MAFHRLLEVGDEAAVSAHAQTAILDQADAWSEFMAASVIGEPTIDQHSALQQSDPEGYAAIVSASADGLETRERVRAACGHGGLSGDLEGRRGPRIPADPHKVKEDPTEARARVWMRCGSLRHTPMPR